MKPLISICMIVKDEEKNIRRCLDSLDGLLVREDVELIVVDTGSTDKTPDIIREFSDQVHFKPWNNSFSDMRNFSISFASGEWIFIMDADETLETPAEDIIGLLCSPETDAFNTIRIIEQNILTKDETYTSSFVQERFFRNDGKFHYAGSVHNQPIFRKPVHQSRFLLKHFGYLNDDPDLMERKFQRTATMLKDELEKNPTNFYYRYQLGKAYSMTQRFVDALREIRTAYDMAMERTDLDIEKKFFIYGEYAKLLVHLLQYDEAIHIAREGISHKPDYLDLHFFLGMACHRQKDWTGCIDALREYDRLYQLFFTDASQPSDTQVVDFHSLSPNFHFSGLLMCIEALFKEKRHAEAEQLAHDLKEGANKYRILCEMYDMLGDHQKLRQYLESLQSDSERVTFVQAVEDYSHGHPESEEAFNRAFSPSDQPYGRFCAVRLDQDDQNAAFQFLLRCKIQNLLVYPYVEAVERILPSPGKLLTIFNRMNKSKLELFLKVLLERNLRSVRAALVSMLDIPCSPRDEISRRTRISVAKSCLVHSMHERSLAKGDAETYPAMQRLFEIFVNEGLAWCSFRHDMDHVLLIMEDVASTEELFLFNLHLMRRSWDYGLVQAAGTYAEAASRLIPEFAEFLSAMVKKTFIK